jgi:NhaP-type Na+/H+ or K+/H+ antiporter
MSSAQHLRKQIIGALLGLWDIEGDLGLLGDSMHSWVNITPELILIIFLPALIFGSAMAVDYHVFSREIPQMLVLAIPGVAIASMLTAMFAIYVLPFGWGWNEGLAFGAMLSATDPVAVVSEARQL